MESAPANKPFAAADMTAAARPAIGANSHCLADRIVARSKEIQKDACDQIEALFLVCMKGLGGQRRMVQPDRFVPLTPEEPVYQGGLFPAPQRSPRAVSTRTARSPYGAGPSPDDPGELSTARGHSPLSTAREATSPRSGQEPSTRTGRALSPFQTTTDQNPASQLAQEPGLQTGRSPSPHEQGSRFVLGPKPHTGRGFSPLEPSARTGRALPPYEPNTRTGRELSAPTGRGRSPYSPSTRTGKEPSSTRTGLEPNASTARLQSPYEPSTRTGRGRSPYVASTKTGKEPLSTRTGQQPSVRTGRGVSPQTLSTRTGRGISPYAPSTRTGQQPETPTARGRSPYEPSTRTGRPLSPYTPSTKAGQETSTGTGRGLSPYASSTRTGQEPSTRTGRGLSPYVPSTRTGQEPSTRPGLAPSTRTGQEPETPTARGQSPYEPSTRTGRGLSPYAPSTRTGQEPSTRTGRGLSPYAPSTKTGKEPSTRTGRGLSPYPPSTRTGEEPSTRTGLEPSPQTGREPDATESEPKLCDNCLRTARAKQASPSNLPVVVLDEQSPKLPTAPLIEEPDYKTALAEQSPSVLSPVDPDVKTALSTTEQVQLIPAGSQVRVESYEEVCPMCCRPYVVKRQIREDHVIVRRSRALNPLKSVRQDDLLTALPHSPYDNSFLFNNSVSATGSTSSGSSYTTSSGLRSRPRVRSRHRPSQLSNLSANSSQLQYLEEDDQSVPVNVLVIERDAGGVSYRREHRVLDGALGIRRSVKILMREFAPGRRLATHRVYLEHEDALQGGRVSRIDLSSQSDQPIASLAQSADGVSLVLDIAGFWDGQGI